MPAALRRSPRLAAKQRVSYAEDEDSLYAALYSMLQLSYQNLHMLEQLQAAIREQPVRRSPRLAAKRM